jgi:DNA polymerase-3 subunit delta'
MLTMAIQCERQPRELRSYEPALGSSGQALALFCGHCSNCTRIASAINLDDQVAAAVAAREELRETDKKETRVLIQPHPDVLILPPDPPQLLIKLGQVRTLIQRAHYLPAEAPRRVFILTAANMMKEAANSLLKILEEPPATVHIFILAENPGELLPTIRSRCANIRLGALPVDEIEGLLIARRPEVSPKQRALIARLSQGAAGRALGFDLDAYTAARADALIFLRNAAATASGAPATGPGGPSFPAKSERVGSSTGARGPSTSDPDHTALFKMTETYRTGADGQQKTTALLRALSLLLEDLLLLNSGTPELLRNIDLRAELDRLAQSLSFDWIERASHALDQVQSGMRRNLLRSLSLDAMAAAFTTHAIG